MKKLLAVALTTVSLTAIAQTPQTQVVNNGTLVEPTGLKCVAWDAAPVKTFKFTNMCSANRAKVFRFGNEYFIRCDGDLSGVPKGSVELREYYVVKPK